MALTAWERWQPWERWQHTGLSKLRRCGFQMAVRCRKLAKKLLQTKQRKLYIYYKSNQCLSSQQLLVQHDTATEWASAHSRKPPVLQRGKRVRVCVLLLCAVRETYSGVPLRAERKCLLLFCGFIFPEMLCDIWFILDYAFKSSARWATGNTIINTGWCSRPRACKHISFLQPGNGSLHPWFYIFAKVCNQLESQKYVQYRLAAFSIQYFSLYEQNFLRNILQLSSFCWFTQRQGLGC